MTRERRGLRAEVTETMLATAEVTEGRRRALEGQLEPRAARGFLTAAEGGRAKEGKRLRRSLIRTESVILLACLPVLAMLRRTF